MTNTKVSFEEAVRLLFSGEYDHLTAKEFRERFPLHEEPNTLRLKSCVEQWPECEEGKYDPRCCRFPKSCSCTIYDPKKVNPEDLEPLK